MEENDFQYSAEYAKSSRASCRHCKNNIEKGSLRLAVLVQSPTFDGKIPYWYHYMCFFAKQMPKSVEDISHFDSLRWDDQEKIKGKIGGSGGGEANNKSTVAKSSKSSKKDKNFSIEYAKSGRAACKGCEEKILKGEIRISTLDFESEKAKRFGPIPQWRHVDCFIGLRSELQYYSGGEDLPGFNTLSADDKKIIREKIRPIKKEIEDETDSSSKEKTSGKDSLIKKQNILMFSYRDKLEKNLSKSELAMLLEYNDYDPLSGESRMLDALADLMTFGNIGRCKVCKTGNLRFRSGVGYFCNGSISEWAKCTNIEEKPARLEFIIPEELKETYSFLKKYKYKKNGDREFVVKQTQSGNSAQGIKRKEIEKSEPMESLVFAIVGIKDKKGIKEKVQSLGGKISSTIDASTAAVFTTKDLVDKESKKLQAAKTFGVDCIPEDFFDASEPSDILMRVKAKNMASWAKEEVVSRLSKIKKLKSSHAGLKDKNSYESNMPDKMKIVLKDGGQVDSKSGLGDTCHVYKQSEKLYSVVLGLVDISRGLNSYYKLQVLESDDKNNWYLFRSWGRIGTNIGDYRVEDKDDLQDALASFNKLYEEKTGNKFKSKKQEKLPGYWFPLDIDHGEKDKDKFAKLNVKKSKSKLAVAIQELISLIFDVKKMECTMMEYELDLKKMPLGKLSQKQINDAFKVLSEAMEWIEKLVKKEESEETKASSNADIVTIRNHILDCSNRFYTLIPHDFGVKNPPLLDDEEYIKNKIDMVNSLKEIEIAYNLLKSENKDSKSMDPIDEAYKKLKTDIEILEKSSKEFDLIQKYLKNTHAATHSHYSLELEEVFKIKRHGEEKRFKPFKKLHNRQLLWHGSRITNFVGILSQGLRIAPPEAPVTGYMFGKGVYFADMVSKSANYCCTSSANPTGLLLLCDVALGDMYELKGAKSIAKLPPGKHSTKGLGSTSPDPDELVKLDDGLQVPLGTPKPTNVTNATLLYNEYIVYDTSQINIKYLLKTSFKYKY